LSDRSYRQSVARDLDNSVVQAFWLNEFDEYSPAFRAAVTAPLHNKVGALLTDPTLRRFFTEKGAFLDLREIMDEGATLVVNLDKGRLGENGTNLIGSLLPSHIGLTGLARSHQPEPERRHFAVFVDAAPSNSNGMNRTSRPTTRMVRISSLLLNRSGQFTACAQRLSSPRGQCCH